MKKLFIAATVMLLGTATVHAQTQNQTADNTVKKHKMVRDHAGFDKLNLSDDQKKQFKDLNENYRKQFSGIRNNTSLSADEKKSQSAALRKEQHQKMRSLLTPEQKTEMASKRKGKSQAMMHKGGQRFDKMKTNLGLTDEQAAKLKTSQADFHQKAKAIKTNSSLTEEQKKEQVKALVKQRKEDMKSLLTSEQLEKMKAGRKGKSSNGSIK